MLLRGGPLRSSNTKGLALTAIGIVTAFSCVRDLPKVPLCGLRHFFGVECPTCGTTRSLGYILHGQFSTAWLLNPVGFVVAIALLRYLVTLAMPRGTIARAINSYWCDKGLLIAFFGMLGLKMIRAVC